MTRGRPLQFLVVALGLFVAGVGALGAREHLPSRLVWALVVADATVVASLVALAWRMR